MLKTNQFKEWFSKKENKIKFFIFIVFSIFIFSGGGGFLTRYAPTGLYLLIIELTIIIMLVSVIAGYVVIKSFFWVGAYLSLTIFLAQAYCGLPLGARTGDDALKSLLILSLSYITIDFLYSLYKEIYERLENVKDKKEDKSFWILLILFVLFVGLFICQIYQVANPIILNLCVYK